MLKRLWYDETGLTSVEYALVLAIMALVTFAIGAMIAARVRGSASTSVSASR